MITSRIGYCNLLYIELPWKLKLIQNMALMGIPHLQPVLRKLNWLLVEYCISFNVMVLTFTVLNGLGPTDFKDCLSRYTTWTALHSAYKNLLVVPGLRDIQTSSIRAELNAVPQGKYGRDVLPSVWLKRATAWHLTGTPVFPATIPRKQWHILEVFSSFCEL